MWNVTVQLSFAKAERAVESVHARMMRVVEALDRIGIDYAVVGGNAVAVWVSTVDPGAVRNTKDVDLLLHRHDLPKARRAMDGAGFELQEVHGIHMFLDRSDPMPSRGVHLLFVGEKVRLGEKYPVPGFENVLRSEENVPVVGLEQLLGMKLQSYRDLDRVHIRDLLRVGLITDAVTATLPPDLRERLEAIVADPLG